MGSRSEHNRIAKQISETFSGLLGVAPGDVELRAGDIAGTDFPISAVGQTFMVEFRTSTGAASIAAGCKQVLEQSRRTRRRVVPVLAVPFMGEVGRRLCDDTGVGWFDLSGNARIIAPGIRIIVDGRPNRFLSAGRPANLFAAKSSRVVRWLLVHATEPLTQRQIARATDMTEGFVSRLVGRLEQEGYLVRDERGAVRPKDPALLLDAWRETYQFSKHTIHQGHVAARTGDALLRFTSEKLTEQGIKYAATGLAAAWVLTQFAAFRITTVYLPTTPSTELLDRLGFREDSRGANIWLVVPNDAGVFQAAQEKDGIQCVHPVQVYIDLKGHPERAPEAAERLRSELLTWRRDG